MYFIDESGSITKKNSLRSNNRYFVICFVHTDDPVHFRKVYKKAVGNLKKHHSEFFKKLKNPNELKGTEAAPFMKHYIFEQLIKKTDIKIHYIVVDNFNDNLRPEFRAHPNRSFNYLIKLIMENCSLTTSEKNKLNLEIDNRNSALKSLKSLEDYLYTDLTIHKRKTNNVSIQYVDSSTSYGVQAADLLANTYYQYLMSRNNDFPSFKELTQSTNLSYPETSSTLISLLKPKICLEYIFPPQSNLDEVAVTKA